MLQPVLDIDEVTDFLGQWAGDVVVGVSQFSNGQVSSVFAFEVLGDASGPPKEGGKVKSGRYVARFVASEYGGAVSKDRFIAPRAAAVGVPTPRLLKYGEVSMSVGNLTDEEKESNDAGSYPLAFAICDLMPGEYMGELQDKDRRYLIPAAVRSMDRISMIDISDTSGWGWFDNEGNGKLESWAEYLGEESFPESGGDFYERRRAWFDDGFLEFDVFRKFSDRMMELVARLPDIDRSVVHIDFGHDNTLVIGNEVSAVVDWDNSIIGDLLYDGARSDVYAPDIDFKQLFSERYASTGRVVHGFEDRWLVCQLHVVLQELQWYGRSNKEAAYHWMKARMLFLLGEGDAVGRHPEGA